MRVALIGRSEVLYETAEKMRKAGHAIPLIITAREAPEYTRTSDDFQKLANAAGSHFIHSPKINTPEVTEQILSLEPIDIAVSINYSGIIDASIISLFRLGILNAHGGDLPRYRGNACQAWAIINGESRVGLCVHRMIGGELDSGDIIVREYLPIDINTKIGTIYRWLGSRVPEMFLRAVSMLAEDPKFVLEQQSKDPKDALRCYPRIPEDGRIDWNKSNDHILRLINASSEPFAGAFCDLDGQRLVIWDAELWTDSEIYSAVSGQIAQINQDGSVIVICGQGKIKVNEAQLGEMRGSPGTFVKSIRKRLR